MLFIRWRILGVNCYEESLFLDLRLENQQPNERSLPLTSENIYPATGSAPWKKLLP